MKKYENISLVGLYMIISGIFMPWHSFGEYYNLPGVLGEVQRRISGFAFGYNSMLGCIILATALLMCVLVFIPKKGDIGKRMLTAQAFLVAFICMIFIIGGLIPIFIFDSIMPHIGLVFVGIGCLTTIIGTMRGLRDCEPINQTDTIDNDEERQEEKLRERDKV